MSVITHQVLIYHFHQGDAGFKVILKVGPKFGARIEVRN